MNHTSFANKALPYTGSSTSQNIWEVARRNNEKGRKVTKRYVKSYRRVGIV